MRLKDVYMVCKKNYEFMSSCTLVINGNHYLIENNDQLEKVIKQLSGVKFLEEPIRDLKEVIEYINHIHPLDTDIYDQDIRHKLSSALNILLEKMDFVISIYESLALDQEETIGLDIKLPITKDFTDFKKNIDDLEFIITKCIFFKSETENLQFCGLDVGSAWLTFAVTGVAGTVVGSVLLNNIAAFIDKCMVIKSHKLTIQQQKNEIEKSKLDQEAKAKMIQNIEDIYKIQLENALTELEDTTGQKIEDGDEKGRVMQSFEKLDRLIDKGLQIYASIDSPSDTKVLFEPLEMKYLSIEKGLKVIEKKDYEENSN